MSRQRRLTKDDQKRLQVMREMFRHVADAAEQLNKPIRFMVTTMPIIEATLNPRMVAACWLMRGRS